MKNVHFINVLMFSLRTQMKDIIVTINISFFFKRPAEQFYLQIVQYINY